MKKTLLALAVLGAASGATFAQSNVTVYGLVDIGLVRESGGAAGSVTKLTSGIANGSRVGFKGTEDLGGGLSAVFAIENGFQADTGTLGQGGLMFGRQAFVGLSGGFGTVKFGRQYTPVDILLGGVDPFGNGFAGKVPNVFAAGYVSRINNGVIYTTPTMGGFSGDLAYGFGEVAGNTSANRYIGMSAGYSQGSLFARIAHQDSENATATGSAKNTALAAAYDFGVARAHFAYGVNKTDAAGVTTLDNNDVMVGVSVPVGVGKIMASYVRKDDKLAVNRDADQIGLGYAHSLSKRTTLYAAAARINNKRGATYTVGSAIEAGSGDKAFNLGVRHTF